MRFGPNWYQIRNKICFVPKVSNYSVKKDGYVNKLEVVIFGI